MQQDIINSLVRAEFVIYGDELDFNEINAMMNIFNSTTRKSSDFPIREYAQDEWYIRTEYESSEDINIQIDKICDLIENKLETINRIKKRFNAQCKMIIVVKQENSDLIPAIYFETDFIKMLASIDADLDVDFT